MSSKDYFLIKSDKFVIFNIPIFGTNIFYVNKTNKYLPSVEKWEFTVCVPLKIYVDLKSRFISITIYGQENVISSIKRVFTIRA